MNVTDVDAWVPGDLTWSQLNFTQNCTVWGQWIAALLQPDPWDPNKFRSMDIEMGMLLFLSAIPKNYSTPYDNLSAWFADVSWWFAFNMLHTEVPATKDQIAYYQASERFNKAVLLDPKEACATEFCKAVGYTGSQDLCGIGVVVSYFLEAILATMYLVVFTIHQVTRQLNKNVYKKPRPKEKQSAAERVLDSFRGSLDMFLSGAMLIAVAMLGAAVYSSITAAQERKQPNPDLPSGEAVYEMALSLIASNFAVFPVMLLYALVKHEGHRKWLHRCVLFILWALSASVCFLAPRAEIDFDERKSGHKNFECDQRGSQYWHIVKATQFLVIGMPILWLVITVFLTTGFKIPGMVDKTWVKNCRGIWRLLVAWINLLLMWGILAYFAHFRQKIINAADGLDKNDRWTFGQVLALAAWVPVVAELLYIMIWGLEDSLSGHMPSGYHAAHTAHTTQADPNMGVPLLNRQSTYENSLHDLKHTSSHTSFATTASSPPPSGPPSQQTAWHNPGYQPFQQQQQQQHQQSQVHHRSSWDPYYHTGW